MLPRGVDETISMGVRGSGILSALIQLANAEEEGLSIASFEDTDSLRAAVEPRKIEVGIEFSDGFMADVMAGRETTVTIFVRPSLPEEITGAMQSIVREIAYAIAGYQLPVTGPEGEIVVIGEDRAGDQVPFRDQLRPLYAFVVLMLEAIAHPYH